MKSYVCDLCGYVYDPAEGDEDNGVAPGTAFEDLPEDWVCPLCGAGKEDFSEEEEQIKRALVLLYKGSFFNVRGRNRDDHN